MFVCFITLGLKYQIVLLGRGPEITCSKWRDSRILNTQWVCFQDFFFAHLNNCFLQIEQPLL